MKAKIKGAAKSRTIWFNSITGMLLVALPKLQDALPSLQSFITPEIYRWLLIVAVVGNIILRAVTDTALEDKQ